MADTEMTRGEDGFSFDGGAEAYFKIDQSRPLWHIEARGAVQIANALSIVKEFDHVCIITEYGGVVGGFVLTADHGEVLIDTDTFRIIEITLYPSQHAYHAEITGGDGCKELEIKVIMVNAPAFLDHFPVDVRLT